MISVAPPPLKVRRSKEVNIFLGWAEIPGYAHVLGQVSEPDRCGQNCITQAENSWLSKPCYLKYLQGQ